MPDLVADLRRMLAGATSRPDLWKTGPLKPDNAGMAVWTTETGESYAAHAFRPSEAALVVAAVNALPQLLDRLETAEAAVAFLRGVTPLIGTVTLTQEAAAWRSRAASLLDAYDKARR